MATYEPSTGTNYGDISSVADGNNAVYASAGTFPAFSCQNANYFRDVVFAADPVTAVGTPTRLALVPATATTQTGAAVSYTATIQDANGNTVTTATNGITFSASGGVRAGRLALPSPTR